MSPQKVKCLVIIIILIVIISWIVYRLFSLEGIDSSSATTVDETVRVANINSDIPDSIQREIKSDEEKDQEQTEAQRVAYSKLYNTKLKPEYDAAVIAYEICEAEENKKAAYKKDLDEYNSILKPEYDANLIAYNNCLQDKDIEEAKAEARRIVEDKYKQDMDKYNVEKPKHDAALAVYNQCLIDKAIEDANLAKEAKFKRDMEFYNKDIALHDRKRIAYDQCLKDKAIEEAKLIAEAKYKQALDDYKNRFKPEYDAKLNAYYKCREEAATAEAKRKQEEAIAEAKRIAEAKYKQAMDKYNVEKPKHDAALAVYDQCLKDKAIEDAIEEAKRVKKINYERDMEFYNTKTKPEYDAKRIAYDRCLKDKAIEEAKRIKYEQDMDKYIINKTIYDRCLRLNNIYFTNYTKIIRDKEGIHGMCIYNNTLIMCDYNNSKIYFYSEQNGVWVEETNRTLNVVSVAPNPTGVCVTRDGKRLIIVSRGKSNVCISTMNENGSYRMPVPIPKFSITWPGSPCMTPDGNVLIVPEQLGPSIYCGIWNGSSYDFKRLSIPKRDYYCCSISYAGDKIAYTSTSNNKVYVTTLNPSNEYNVIEEKEVGEISSGSMRMVTFAKTNENLIFVTSVGSTNNSQKFHYSIFRDGVWGSLVPKSEPIPDNFDATGLVMGENNTLYIAQYSRSNSDIYKSNYTYGLELKHLADAGKKLYNDKRVVTGSAITGSGIWGSSPSSSIISRIRPETAYIWNSTKQVSGDRANFKYIYTNTTDSPFNAKMYIIADNYADFEFNGKHIRSFSEGGWPNLGFKNGIGPIDLLLNVGENTFVFKCRNDGGPAGLAVIVTDANDNRLFNTESGLNNLNSDSELNDGWQIV